MQATQREQCFDALMKVYKDGGYSSVTLRNALKTTKATTDAALISSIFYGVLERDLTLSYLIDRYAKQPQKKIDLAILVILKMGFYQLFFLDGIPARAAVHETVSLCVYARKTSAKGFVNALLRAAIREHQHETDTASNPTKSISLRFDHLPVEQARSLTYSCPLWLLKQWDVEYGMENTEEMLKATLGCPPIMVRVNTLKITAKALVMQLEQAGVQVQYSRYLENCLILTHTGNIENLQAFSAGYFHVQDLASQFCAKLVDAKPGMTVLDLCAAPGSKSFTIAQYMQGVGKLLSFDQHDHKLTLITKGATRLGIDNLVVNKQDATVYDAQIPLADRVLCDVPCAGLGAIRRKPEIKYKHPQEFVQLPKIQEKILNNGASYVKPGGMLIYATCSLSHAENEAVATKFLQTHQAFTIQKPPKDLVKNVLSRDNMITFLPQYMDSDGFFVAVFLRES